MDLKVLNLQNDWDRSIFFNVFLPYPVVNGKIGSDLLNKVSDDVREVKPVIESISDFF